MFMGFGAIVMVPASGSGSRSRGHSPMRARGARSTSPRPRADSTAGSPASPPPAPLKLVGAAEMAARPFCGLPTPLKVVYGVLSGSLPLRGAVPKHVFSPFWGPLHGTHVWLACVFGLHITIIC